MKPASFKYILAGSIDEALSVKAEYGEDARFLAGGQSLVPSMNFRLAQPSILIDINRLPGCAGVRNESTNSVCIGALTRYRDIERDFTLQQNFPILRDALPEIAHPQIRNRGTIGGNLANADPASELPAIVLALGGRLGVQSIREERWISAADFFVDVMTTALEADEMLTEIDLPIINGRFGMCFLEVARRRGDFALMGVACILQFSDDGICRDARICLCNAGNIPIFATEASQSLVGLPVCEAGINAAAELVQTAIDPGGSVHASKQFQRHLAGVLTQRALTKANMRAKCEH